jgi:hypothetical protein
VEFSRLEGLSVCAGHGWRLTIIQVPPGCYVRVICEEIETSCDDPCHKQDDGDSKNGFHGMLLVC